MNGQVVMTLPGKIGDAIHQWPVAAQWAYENHHPMTIWLDENSLKPLVPLLECQPYVEAVELKPGISNYNCGGQPWHFDLPTSEYENRTVYHLGLRSFTVRQLTIECYESSKVPVKADMGRLAEVPTFTLRNPDKKNRLVLHGQNVCPHTQTTPGFWRFLKTIEDWATDEFDEVCFVGSQDDLDTAEQVYPKWNRFSDDGNFLKLAEFLIDSRAMIGCGSSPVALAQALKIPTVRVHDPIGDHPKVIWSGLGDNQLNDTEADLRDTWPEFRDRWITKGGKHAEAEQSHR